MVNHARSGAFPVQRPKGSFPSPHDLNDYPPKQSRLRLGLLRCGKQLVYPSSKNNNNNNDLPSANSKAALQLKNKLWNLQVDPDTIPLLESMEYDDFSRRTL